MTMENLVTSKEVSEKLKKLGVGQESVFSWGFVSTGRGEKGYWDVRDDWGAEQVPTPKEGTEIAAYTLSELKEPLKPYMKDIEISARDDIFNPDFWGNLLVYCLRK